VVAIMETLSITNSDFHVSVNGISVSYTDEGKGETPLIFIHGFPFNKTTWRIQSDFLKEDHRVITYDIRGFGQSTLNKEIASIDLFASDLLGLMDVLKIEKAVACGLSMGGYILMNALGRFPERFKAVILSDTQCIADSDKAKEKRNNTIKQIEKEGLKSFSEDFSKAVFCDETLKNKPVLVTEIEDLIRSTPPETITATLNALANRRENCTQLKTINLPALIMYGKEDKLIPVSQSELLFNTLQNSKLYGIEKAGHLANLEQPETFNRYLSDFIKNL
jgi:3-oxoadipate enol-lactonase